MSELEPPEHSPELYEDNRQRMAQDLLYDVASEYTRNPDIPSLTQDGLNYLHPDALWPVFKTLTEWYDPEKGWRIDGTSPDMPTDNAVVAYITHLNMTPYAELSKSEQELAEQLLESQENFDYFECFVTIAAGRHEVKRKQEQWKRLRADHDPSEVETPSILEAWNGLTKGLEEERQYERQVRREVGNMALLESRYNTESSWYSKRLEVFYKKRLDEDRIERFMSVETLKMRMEEIQAVDPITMAQLVWDAGLDDEVKDAIQEYKAVRQSAEEYISAAGFYTDYKDGHFRAYVRAVASGRSSSSMVNDAWSQLFGESQLDIPVKLLIGDLDSLPPSTREAVSEDPRTSLRSYTLKVANVLMRSDIIPL